MLRVPESDENEKSSCFTTVTNHLIWKLPPSSVPEAKLDNRRTTLVKSLININYRHYTRISIEGGPRLF